MIDPENGEKDPLVAAFASLLLPGAGQLYNGQILKGIAILSIWVLLLFFVLATFSFVIITMVVWVYSIKDASKQAKKDVADEELGFDF